MRTIVCSCVCMCVLTALGHTAGDDKEPWQIHTLTTIYNLNSSHILYISATCRMLTLASIIDITGGLELTRTELWISNSNVSQMSIGLYTTLCPNSALDYSIFVLQGWNYNSVWLQCERLFCNPRMSAENCMQLRKISLPPPSLCSSWIYYDHALCLQWAGR